MIFRGVSVNWGIGTNISGVTGLMQTRDHSFSSNSELILDGGDTPVSKVWWGMYEEATFTYVVVDYSYYRSGNAQYYVPDIGDIVTLSDTNNNQLDGDWFVDSASTHTSNTTCTRVTLKISRYPHVAAI